MIDFSSRSFAILLTTGTANNRTATLTVPVGVTSAETTLRYDQIVHTEDTDLLTLQVSADNGVTWTTLPATLDGTLVSEPTLARR